MGDGEYKLFMFGPVEEEQANKLVDYLSKIIPPGKIRRILRKEVPPAVEAENEFLCWDTGAPIMMKTTFVRLMLKYSFELMPLKGDKVSIYEKRGRFGPDTKFVIFKVKYSELEARVRKDLYEIADLTKQQNVLRIMESHTAPPTSHVILGPFVEKPDEGQFCMDDMELLKTYVFGDEELHKRAMPMASVGDGGSQGSVFTKDAMEKDETLEYRKGPLSVKYGDLARELQGLVRQKMDKDDYCIVLRYSVWFMSPESMILIKRVKEEPRRVLREIRARLKFAEVVKQVVKEDKAAQEITNQLWGIALDIALELDETMARDRFIYRVKLVLHARYLGPNNVQGITHQTSHEFLEMRRELKSIEVACPASSERNRETGEAPSFVNWVGLRNKLMARLKAGHQVKGNATRLEHNDKATQPRSQVLNMPRNPKPKKGVCPMPLPPNKETGQASSFADRNDLRAKLMARQKAVDPVEGNATRFEDIASQETFEVHKKRRVDWLNDDVNRLEMYQKFCESERDK